MISTGTKVLIGVILALIMALLTVGKMYDNVTTERSELKAKLERITTESAESKRIFNERIEAYKYARDEVAKYYNEAIEAIENFKRGDNETECEAADRLFSSVKY